MVSAYFSNIRKEIISILNEANKEVMVAMAWFTSSELFDALISCIQRGVRVKIVLLDDAINWQPYAPDFNKLIEKGASFYVAKYDVGFMHHKFCVVDDNYVITGSYNWTYYAETRNVENIVISSDSNLIHSYIDEFHRLIDEIEISNTSPRWSWEELERANNVDYSELNYEVNCIAKAQNLQERKVFTPQTVVTVIDKPIIKVSKYDIGIKATSHGINCRMTTIIPKGTKLPYTSTSKTFYSYSDQRDNIMCTILYGDETTDTGLAFITEEPVTQITAGRNDYELTITIQFTLDEFDYLVARIKCVETGIEMVVQTKNMNLVKCED